MISVDKRWSRMRWSERKLIATWHKGIELILSAYKRNKKGSKHWKENWDLKCHFFSHANKRYFGRILLIRSEKMSERKKLRWKKERTWTWWESLWLLVDIKYDQKDTTGVYWPLMNKNIHISWGYLVLCYERQLMSGGGVFFLVVIYPVRQYWF